MTITLIENFRAVFYAPFYAAVALDTYKAEGLEVKIELSADAARTAQRLMAGVGDVMWGGPLRLMMAREQHSGARPVAFCEVVGRDPFFVLGREPNPAFKIADLIGKRFAAVTEVPTPWMCLKQDLRLAGIDLARLTLAPERTMLENAAALRSGDIDLMQVFQPLAEELVQSGAAHIWYTQASRGPTSYTTFNTTRDYADRNPDALTRMCRAMYRTLKWVSAHSGDELARLIADYFPDLDRSTLAHACERYKRAGLWNETPLMHREGLEWLRDAALADGKLKQTLRFEDIADMRFAQQAIDANPPSR